MQGIYGTKRRNFRARGLKHGQSLERFGAGRCESDVRDFALCLLAEEGALRRWRDEPASVQEGSHHSPSTGSGQGLQT